MVIDISQFHDVFFEESFEGLDIMESELLELKQGTADPESINTIFRAAHSLKGGAGTFGFTVISELTHTLETMLNDMRNGQKEVSDVAIKLLLESVDLLRGMLTATKQKQAIDEVLLADFQQRLTAMMAGVGETEQASSDDGVTLADEDAVNASPAVAGWSIYFRPHPHLFQTGNDPVRMLRELATLGELSTEVLDDILPPFSDLEPEDSYLAWQLTLKGDIPKEEIDEIFDWVDQDCDLKVEALEADVIEQDDIVEAEAEAIMTAPEAPEQIIVEEAVVDFEPALEVEEQAELEVEEPEEAESKPEPLPQAPVQEPEPTQIKKASPTASGSIRVGTEKVDSLINMVSELVITQSMLSQLGDTFTPDRLPDLIDGLAQLERNTRDMQEAIMRIRMLPISFAFNRFPRLVHDLTEQTGKQVELKLTGEQTEVDKSIMEKIGDPLVHLVRNALDHGLETPEARLAAGKPAIGSLELKAFHQGGNIVIEIEDDGAGLDEEKIFAKAVEKGLINATDSLSNDKIYDLIFLPGFSTAAAVTDVSGRGVGMDVVRKNIASLSGSIEVQSTKGEGTIFTIRLPLTLAIMDGQTIQVANEKYILPLVSIIETIEIKENDIKHVAGKGELYALRDEYIPIIRLYDVFNLKPQITELDEGMVVIAEGDGQKVGIFIDDLLGQQQVVIKSLEDNYRKVIGLSGATILGDGSVALILDVAGLWALFRDPTLALATVNEQVS